MAGRPTEDPLRSPEGAPLDSESSAGENELRGQLELIRERLTSRRDPPRTDQEALARRNPEWVKVSEEWEAEGWRPLDLVRVRNLILFPPGLEVGEPMRHALMAADVCKTHEEEASACRAVLDQIDSSPPVQHALGADLLPQIRARLQHSAELLTEARAILSRNGFTLGENGQLLRLSGGRGRQYLRDVVGALFDYLSDLGAPASNSRSMRGAISRLLSPYMDAPDGMIQNAIDRHKRDGATQ